MRRQPLLSSKLKVDLGIYIRENVDPAEIVGGLLKVVRTSPNAVAVVGAVRALAELGWGKARQSVEITHVTQDEVERRRVAELLAERAPAVLEELAGWAERVVPPALPAPSCPCGGPVCMGGQWCPGPEAAWG
jgi:hypothetical protein